MTEQLTSLVAKFYNVPAIASIVDSNPITRIAVRDYGVPIFFLVSALVFFLLILLLLMLKPKKGRPKKIKEKKPARSKAKPEKKQERAMAAPKAVMKKLAKLPPSTLPLYPVADKRPAISEDLLAAELAMAPVPEPEFVAPAVASTAAVPSFALDDMAGQDITPAVAAAEIELAPTTNGEDFSPVFDDATAEEEGSSAPPRNDDFDPAPQFDASDFAAIEDDPGAAPTVSDDPEIIDGPGDEQLAEFNLEPSFGSGDDELSDDARRKLDELQNNS